MLRDFFRKYGWRYLPGAVFLVLCAWISTRAPLALGNAIEMVTSGDWNAFLHETLKILWIALGVFITRDLWRYFIVVTSREMEVYLRDRLYHHLQLLPVKFYGENRSGDLMAYAVNDVGAVRMTFGMVVAQILNALSSFVFSVTSMAGEVNPRLTLLALIPVPFAIAAVLIIGKKVRLRFRRVQELFSFISGHVQENINGMRVLKAFAQEKPQEEVFARESDEKRRANIALYKASAMLQPMISVIFGLSYVVGLVYGGQLVLDGEISLAGYVAFNAYLALIVMPINAVGRIANNLERGIASYKRLSTLMNEPEVSEFDRIPDGKPIEGALEARNLTFQYPDAAAPALKNVSFRVAPGGTLGIVGPTGSGKSTLIQLLTKLIPAERGELFIDGRDVNDIPAASIRNAAGYVPQDGFLFNISLRENISFFSGADLPAVERAARAAGLAADVEKLPDGYETLCGERG
ncbi:MAG: ATP-binding cassette domain-containing protein, partial [Clostridia bacterium]|nr:ATP-binding cassette domain-containing protein [Clostridia bacterium]